MLEKILIAALYLLQLVWIYLIFRPLLRKVQDLWDVPVRLRELEFQTRSLEEMVLRMHHRMKDLEIPGQTQGE